MSARPDVFRDLQGAVNRVASASRLVDPNGVAAQHIAAAWAALDRALGAAQREQEAEARKCPKCDGCGQVANSDDQEPWTVWENLPVKSAAAVVLGLVRPVTCPVCSGSGSVTA